MKVWLRNTIYTRKFGIEFDKTAYISEEISYKYLITVWMWNKVFLFFILRRTVCKL